VHGYGWYAAYAELMNQVAGWAERLEAEGRFGEVEALLAQLLFSEYCAQLVGGVPMNQGEIVRPAHLVTDRSVLNRLYSNGLMKLMVEGGTQAVKTRVARRLAEARGRPTLEHTGLDETFEMVRDQFHAFAEEKVTPFAQDWHLKDQLIPIELVEELGALGVFGLTIPEEYGGSGMGKTAMCVVSEELSRAWIGVGSLATRSEIAGELILTGGTEAQKQYWLPRIASAEILPTAVFTEPNTGSDLGSLRTKALLEGDNYVVTGAKTWITHAARADVMTLLVRTDPATTDYRGLSMLLAEKPRGVDGDDFPADGMSGGEIGVIGYRGMKEYELGFDGFSVPARNLLGGVPGQGFKQLMATFESARIQTAARAVGVAQAALETGLGYALDRQQFGQAIFEFPARPQQAGDDGRRDHGRAPADLFRRPPEGRGQALRPGGRHGQAGRRPRRLGRRRQRPADPRRQRLRHGIRRQPPAGRRPDPQHLRGGRRDPGPGHRPAAAGGGLNYVADPCRCW
jgi:(2S)-methylsuccinyl-CoA dehydrogenase